MNKLIQILFCAAIPTVVFVAGAAAQTGSISGTVKTDQNENITGQVNLANAANLNVFVSQVTTLNGSYSFNNVADGSYYVYTVNPRTFDANYVSEVHDNVPCQGAICKFEGATAIVISGGNAVTGIDFVLTAGGKISGIVNDGTNQLPGSTNVYLLTSDGLEAARFDAGQTGSYEFSGLAAGSYYVAARSDGYITEYYNGLLCNALFACPVASATPVRVVDGQTTGNINFAMELGGILSGTVTDQQTGAPIQSANIIVKTPGKEPFSALLTDTEGKYSFSESLIPGIYYFGASASNYQGEFFDNFTCAGVCEMTSTTPVTLAAGQSLTLDFALLDSSAANRPDLTGKISGIPTTKKVKKPTLKVKNSNIFNLPTFTVKFYRGATPSFLSTRKKLFKTATITSLNAGDETAITFNAKPDAARPWVLVQIDSDDEIFESSGSNNRLVKKVP